MSSNNRILYSCQAVSISECGATSVKTSGQRTARGETEEMLGTLSNAGNLNYGDMVHGVQSIGIETTFNLDQVFELGQIDIYENIEGIPDVSVSIEKVLDGYPLLYLMATTGVTGAGGGQSGILNRSKQMCDLRLGIFNEAVDNVHEAGDNSGNSEVEVYCSGMYVSNIQYSFPVEGNFSENITLIGNNKEWLTGADVKILNVNASDFDGQDEPGSLVSGSGGVQRREDLLMQHSILPVGIRGVNGSGYGNAYRPVAGATNPFDYSNIVKFMSSGLAVHVQNVNISTDFSREDIFELGRKNPYYRPASFPISVTCSIEAVTTSGDFVTALEGGDPSLYYTKASGNNTKEENIFFCTRAGYIFDLGKKNRLASINYGGGDATGGNVTCTYNYENFNNLEVRWNSHNAPDHIGFEEQGMFHFNKQSSAPPE